MSEMVERAAAALVVALDEMNGPELLVSEACQVVRAVIAAMREPTEAMVDAGWDGFLWGPGGFATSEHEQDAAPDLVWQAMIDTALADVRRAEAAE